MINLIENRRSYGRQTAHREFKAVYQIEANM